MRDYVTHGDSQRRLSPRYPTSEEAQRRRIDSRVDLSFRIAVFALVVIVICDPIVGWSVAMVLVNAGAVGLAIALLFVRVCRRRLS